MKIAIAMLLAGVYAAAFAWSAVAQDKKIGPGTDRWSIKTSADLNQTPKRISISKLKALPPLFAPGVKDLSRKEHETKVYPASIGGLREGQIVAVQHAYLQLIAREASYNKEHDDYEDGDYHIQLGETRDERTGCVIVEIPDPQFVSDPELKTKVANTRAAVLKLLKITQISDSGNCIAHPPRVTVVGQLFWDSAHEGSENPGGGRGKKQCQRQAATLWEVHPVVDVVPEPNPEFGKPALSCK